MPQDYTHRGSQRWLQVAVNLHPETLNAPVRQALGLEPGAEVEWLSPLKSEGFVEYRDGTFVDRLGCKLEKRSLEEFWPPRGPTWDGLARTGRGDLLLVEAKGHIQEMVSTGTRATGEGRERIRAALREAQQVLAPKGVDIVDWSGTFYQYANRLAHLYLLREVNGLPAHLLLVYFLNAHDVNGPTQQAEWEGAIKVVEGYLGLGRHRLSRYVHKVFVDVNALVPAGGAGAAVPS